MDLEFTDEQEQLRDSVRRFLAQRAPLEYVRARYAEPATDVDDAWTGLVELGVLALLVPEDHGGAGLGLVDAAVVLEEAGRALYPGPLTSSAIGAVSLVTLAGSPDDHAALLPGLATGDTVGTVALLEGGRRAEWRTPTTTARVDGETWCVDGRKVHVPDAPVAGLVLVTATDDESRTGVFAVDADAPG